MGNKTGTKASKGVHKASIKGPRFGNDTGAVAKALKQVKHAQPGLSKDAANFLKQRMGKKVRDLRATSSTDGAHADATDMVAAAPPDGGSGLEAICSDASRRGGNFDREVAAEPEVDSFIVPEVHGRGEAENTRKKFYTELRRVLAAADVIIEVLDARDPGSCRSKVVEHEVACAGKRIVFLINKIDLVPKMAVEAWMKHLQTFNPTIAFKAAHGGATRPTHAMTSVERASEGLLQSTHAVVGADELMQLLKNYARCSGGKKKAHVSVGVVGYPNTGKSSVINSMKRYNCVEVGGRAGVTKVMQEIQLDSTVTLIDCPGVVFEGSSDDPSVALRNVVTVESVADPVGVVDAMLTKAPRQALLKFYNFEQEFTAVHDFLTHVAQMRGKLKRGSGLDLPSAARSVISDWTSGKFRYYVMPPVALDKSAATAAEVETAEIVNGLAPRLDIDSLFSGQGAQPLVLGAPAAQEDEAMDADDPAGAVEVDMAAMER